MGRRRFSRKRRSFKRKRFSRRSSRSRRGLKRNVRVPKSAVAKFIKTFGNKQTNIDAGLSNYFAAVGWLVGEDLNTLSQAISANPHETTAGGNVIPLSTAVNPEIRIKGSSYLEFQSGSSAKLFVELYECRQNATTGLSATTIATKFATSWAYSFNTRASGYEFFPTTKLGENWAFFDKRLNGFIKSRVKRFVIPANGYKRIIFRHKETSYNWLDWAILNGSATALTAFKSTFYVFRVCSEQGIVCGVSSYSGANPPVGGIYPVIAPVGADLIYKITNKYQYRINPSKPMPFQTGSWLAQYGNSVYPGTETVSVTAPGWIGMPSHKGFRFTETKNNAADTPPNFTTFGPAAVTNATAFNMGVPIINPIYDCAGDANSLATHAV